MARAWCLAVLAAGAGALGACDFPPLPAAPGDGGGSSSGAWSAVSSGALHTCGIRADGTLWCWGRNDLGQLGLGPDVVEADTPMQVGSATWSAVSASIESTCGIETDGSLWCWGENSAGQVGIGDVTDAIVPTPSEVGGTWQAVTGGLNHACGITSDATMECWGDCSAGECGDGSAGGIRATPVAVSIAGGLPTAWVTIAAGIDFTCALAADHGAWCWGEDLFGQLGNTSAGLQPTPQLVGAAGDAWQQLVVGDSHACALDMAGNARCWGDNDAGQLGDDTTTSGPALRVVGHDQTQWRALGAGGSHTCGVDSAGHMSCWGNNRRGELCSDTSPASFRTTPGPVLSGSASWLAVVAGEDETCAIDTDHQLWCAGGDGGGALGVAGGGSRTSPVRIASTIAAVSVGVGGIGDACAIDTSQHLACWGDNSRGAVGDGTFVDRAAPVAVAGAWREVVVGDHACAIDSSAALWCWGDDTEGQVGDGSSGDVVGQPVAIAPATTWRDVGVDGHSCAATSAGSAACWGGFNSFGEDGQPPNGEITVPTVLAGSATWLAIGAGDRHACALDNHGTVSCWGDNSVGQLGNPPSSGGPIPLVVPGGPFVALSVGGNHTCAGDSGTGFVCWGYNGDGQLGDQTVTSSPTPVALDGAWQQVSAGARHTCGVRADHTLACWGANESGQLGDGTFLEHHEPMPVGSDADWVSVSAGVESTCALEQSGDLYCWGGNLAGEVGDGGGWRSTLVVVP